jgi:hypothetical protein
MSAFGTKKWNGDAGVQLTFPSNFQKAYNAPLMYYPSSLGESLDLLIGSDFQSNYHEEKRLDANRSVMNGLQANRTAERLMLTGPHNYHVPKPVLGQRIFANPMNGAETAYSTRRDNGLTAPFKTIEVGFGGDGTMRGGVVSSLEGQEFYKKQLNRRIAQLNRINALAQGYAVQLGQDYKIEDNTKEGSVDKVTFFIYLRALMDAITAGDLTRFTFENLKEMISMLFKFGPTMSVEDIDDARASLDIMINDIRSGLSEIPEFASFDDEKRAYAETVGIYAERMRLYVNAMEKNFYLSERDKKTLSKSLTKSLGLDRLVRKSRANDVIDEERRTDPRIDQDAEDYDDDDGGDGSFNRPAPTREDDEQRGIPRAPFAGRNGDKNQEIYGRKTGIIVHGGPSWFGESEDERTTERQDLAPRYVAPLGISGSDPNAEGNRQANPDTLREAVEEQTFQVLSPLGFTRDQDEEEFITKNYPNTSDFVNELAKGLEERGFSKAQIAKGMELTGYGVFADYIAENTGETGPEPSTAVRPSGLLPMGGLPPMLYVDNDDDGRQDVVAPNDVAETGSVRTTMSGIKTKLQQRAIESGNYPSAMERNRLFRENNIPTTRNKMYEEYNTEAQYRALGARIPKEFGGPYKMRQGTTVKNAKARIIKLIRDYADPTW